MRISTKGDYATRALQDLALHYDKGPVPIEAIARRQALPVRSAALDHVLTRSGLALHHVEPVFVVGSAMHLKGSTLVKPVGFARLVEELKALDIWLSLNERPTFQNGVSYCLSPAAHGMLPA